MANETIIIITLETAILSKTDAQRELLGYHMYCIAGPRTLYKFILKCVYYDL